MTSRNDLTVQYLKWFKCTKKKNCHRFYILIFCVVGRQVIDGGAYGSAVHRTYANRNPGLNFSLHFYGHFPGGPGLAGTRMFPFWILLELRMMEVVVTTGTVRRAKLTISKPTSNFLQAGCPSCRPTNNVSRALKGKSGPELIRVIMHNCLRQLLTFSKDFSE